MSRAQRLAVAMAAAVAGSQALAACGNSVPIYGAPLPAAGPTAGSAGTGGAGRNGGAGAAGSVVAFPPYGTPAAGREAVDAGAADEDAGSAGTAGSGQAGQAGHGPIFMPLYGAPLPQR